jgi:sugar lactone lactonase YvrE
MDRRIPFLLLVAWALQLARPAHAQSTYEPNLFVTFAGSAPSPGNADGPGNIARFSYPGGVASDSAGNLYVADSNNNTIRKITPAGFVSTLAGLPGATGSADGPGSAARFNNPQGIAVDGTGSIYVSDLLNQTIRKITPDGAVSTLAGLAGTSGSTDGTGTGARFNGPAGITVDSAGNVYVADASNHTIRKITPAGAVSTVAGLARISGSTDGTVSSALFNGPAGVAVDSAGNVYVADTLNYTVRVITPDGVVSTLAGLAGDAGSADGPGSAARLNYPWGLIVDGIGNVFVADKFNNSIRKITAAGFVSTLAGSSVNSGSADGTGSAAQFYGPQAVTADSAGNLYVADKFNCTIRKIQTGGVVSTFAGSATGGAGSTDGNGAAARFAFPSDVAVNASGIVCVADTTNYTIRKITPSGLVSTLAGLAGVRGGDDGTGSAARFSQPDGVAIDNAGNVYVADYGSHTIRKITPAGVVSTLAGLAGNIGSTDGMGSAARFTYPEGVAVDNAGNVYVADWGNCTIRKITPSGQVTTLAGSPGVCYSADGAGSAAHFSSPSTLAVDGTGNVYVSDTDACTIRKVTADGNVTTFAGSTNVIGSADGTGSAARFLYPGGVAVDNAGNVYVADGNSTIRKITPTAVVTTLAGLVGRSGSADGTGNVARFNGPGGIAVDSSGDIYVADGRNSTIRVGGTTPAQLFSVGSTKSHGSIGTWDVNLPVLPFTAPRGIECRTGGVNGDYTIVFTFGNNLVSVGGASVTSGTGIAISATIDANDSHRYLVNLTGVANAQYLTVTINNVIDAVGNYAASISKQMGMLLGDTNGDGLVNVGDTIQVRAQAGNDVTSSNFRVDVNGDGLINIGDTVTVRNQSGTALPIQPQAPPLEDNTQHSVHKKVRSGSVY